MSVDEGATGQGAALAPAEVTNFVGSGADAVAGGAAEPSPGRAASETDGSVDARIERLRDDDSLNNPHAFVVMPFGQKAGPDGRTIDFDAIYATLIRPALLEAGFRPFRADEETVSGDILTDMFQELLLADLVVVDMSIDNANVFYELGVRHALRKRGVVHIQSGRDYMPFDVFNVRTMPYHIDEGGVPDPAHVERDRKSLIRIARDTWASDIEAVHSPVFALLSGLPEPDRRALRTPLATGFWREFNEWEERIAVAHRQKRVGDILLLTDEIDNPLCKEDAAGQAGLALREMGRHELALQEYRKGLAINPKNVYFRREEAILLDRMGRVDEAIIKLESLLADAPSDTKATSYLGRIYTSIWRECWIDLDDVDERRRVAFESCQWAIKSIDTYLAGYHVDRNSIEPGIKAMTLAVVLVQIADRHDDGDDPDADIARVRKLLPDLSGGLRFALDADRKLPRTDYWTWASIGNWLLGNGDTELAVTRAYRKALSYARRNVFRLRSTLRQLDLFGDLDVNGACAAAAREIVRREIERIESDGNRVDENEYPSPDTEVRAFLFSGHALDRPDAAAKRFPPDLEREVRLQIDLALDRGEADANDHAFTAGAACGGDIVFVEACLERGMKVHVHMPCNEAAYVSHFVGFGGENWIERFYAIRNNPRVNLYYQQERVGRPPEGVDAHQRNARWALYASLVLGVDKLRLIALWDGRKEGARDGDGGRVGEMVGLMQEMGGIVDHLDIDKLDYLFRDEGRDGASGVARGTTASVPIDARVELLRQVSLFASLSDVDLTQLARLAGERRFGDAEILAAQGERGDGLFVLVAGEVSVRVRDGEGAWRETARRRAGDCVGELTAVHDECRVASLVAVGEVTALLIEQVRFRRLLSKRPETGLAVTHLLAERLVEATAVRRPSSLARRTVPSLGGGERASGRSV